MTADSRRFARSVINSRPVDKRVNRSPLNIIKMAIALYHSVTAPAVIYYLVAAEASETSGHDSAGSIMRGIDMTGRLMLCRVAVAIIEAKNISASKSSPPSARLL